MKRFFLIGLIVLIGLISCSPKTTLSLIDKQPKLSSKDKVALLDVKHKLPKNVVKVGNLRFQDSGLSTDCTFNSIINRARKIARENGANIVKVIEKRSPNLWSSCYRLKIELLKYNGDVSKLPQYQLTLD